MFSVLSDVYPIFYFSKKLLFQHLQYKLRVCLSLMEGVPSNVHWPCFVGCKFKTDPSARMEPLPVLFFKVI